MTLKMKINGSAMVEMTKKVSLADAKVDKQPSVTTRGQKDGNAQTQTWTAILICVKCVLDGPYIVKRLAQIWE